MLPIAEKLRFQEPGNPITELYINLLARAMDGERIGEAHPAFIGVISQLAPDEVLFLTELSKHEYTLVLRMDEEWHTPGRPQIQQAFNQAAMPPALIERSNAIVFNYDVLNQADLFYVFLEHLYHLGLVQYTNDPSNEGEYKGFSAWNKDRPKFVFIRLSSFGKLFYKACVSADRPSTSRLPIFGKAKPSPAIKSRGPRAVCIRAAARPSPPAIWSQSTPAPTAAPS